MRPLAGEGFHFDAGGLHQLVGGKRHVRVNVPVLHPLNDVNRAVVVRQHTVKERTLRPVIVAGVGDHPARQVRCGSVDVPFEVTFAQGVGVFAVAVNTKRPVDAVVHDHTTSLHASVSPHQFVNADEARHRHDGGKVGVAKSGRLPGC